MSSAAPRTELWATLEFNVRWLHGQHPRNKPRAHLTACVLCPDLCTALKRAIVILAAQLRTAGIEPACNPQVLDAVLGTIVDGDIAAVDMGASHSANASNHAQEPSPHVPLAAQFSQVASTTHHVGAAAVTVGSASRHTGVLSRSIGASSDASSALQLEAQRRSAFAAAAADAAIAAAGPARVDTTSTQGRDGRSSERFGEAGNDTAGSFGADGVDSAVAAVLRSVGRDVCMSADLRRVKPDNDEQPAAVRVTDTLPAHVGAQPNAEVWVAVRIVRIMPRPAHHILTIIAAR